MTELRPMSEAPKDFVEILCLTVYYKEKKWEIISHDEEDWFNGAGIYFREDELLGWLPLPEIEDEIETD